MFVVKVTGVFTTLGLPELLSTTTALASTVKLRSTGAAPTQLLSPAWLARIVHIPADTKVTVAPETVQIVGV
jgi:hypothetical protein